MKKLIRLVREWILILFTGLCLVFAYILWNEPVFSGAENYCFSLGTSSSAQMIFSDNPVKDKWLFRVEGESGEYRGDGFEMLKERFHAKLLFTESVCGVNNYYLYSPDLGDCVLLNGYAVNLHIAVGEEKTVAGTPLIFGGF